MAYAVGSGATGLDLLDAIRSFAVGLGWSVSKWDTTNMLLYISKDACKIALQYYTSNVTVWSGTTSSPVAEGRIRGTLVSSFGPGTDWWTFPGSAVVGNTTGRDSGPLFVATKMQGPFTQWFLFSDAEGSYIHVAVQDGIDTYNHFGFGNADKGGLTHGGVAYAWFDGGRDWFQGQSTTSWTPGSYENNMHFNKPSLCGHFSSSARRFNYACSQALSVDALPAGFTNNVACTTYAASSYASTPSRILPMRQGGVRYNNAPSQYPAYDPTGGQLLDQVLNMEAPAYSSFVPMLGVPIVFRSNNLEQACVVGSIPNVRWMNMTGMSPQQELSLSPDIWKVYPSMRQTNWEDAPFNAAPSSGQYAIAHKKIL